MIKLPTFFNPRAGLTALEEDEPKKRNLYASLLDKFVPSSSEMSDNDKSALGRQGMLQLGIGLLSNGGGFGNALSQGIKGGLLSMQDGVQNANEAGYRRQRLQKESEDPAGFRQADMMARAAGFEPGTPEYQNAMKVGLGVEGRAASGGFEFERVEGRDGRKRLQRLNPRTGLPEIFDDASGEFVPMGGEAPINGGGAPAPISGVAALEGGGSGLAGGQGALDIAGDFEQFSSLGIPVSSTLRSPSRNAKVGGVGNSYHLTGEAVDIVPRTPQEKQQVTEFWKGRGYQVIDEGDHLHVEPPRRGATVSRLGPARAAALGVSRSPEEQAALTTAATEGTKLSFLPQELGARTDAAVDQALRIDSGKATAERAAAAPATIATLQNSLDSIDALLSDPDLDSILGLGSINPLHKIPGSKGKGLIARADQIAGQSFLAAFNQLKGGGAITEKEGEAATKAMARLDRAQSPADYKLALTDLKSALTPGMERARQAAAGGGAQSRTQVPAKAGAPVRRKYNPATGKLE